MTLHFQLCRYLFAQRRYCSALDESTAEVAMTRRKQASVDMLHLDETLSIQHPSNIPLLKRVARKPKVQVEAVAVKVKGKWKRVK